MLQLSTEYHFNPIFYKPHFYFFHYNNYNSLDSMMNKKFKFYCHFPINKYCRDSILLNIVIFRNINNFVN